jgi:hypothetical protein
LHDGLRVARTRVLRLMRARPALAPQRPAGDRDRRIVTDAPNVMWAIDGTQIATVRNG